MARKWRINYISRSDNGCPGVFVYLKRGSNIGWGLLLEETDGWRKFDRKLGYQRP